jgi:serine/threonine protein phosphatase 1
MDLRPRGLPAEKKPGTSDPFPQTETKMTKNTARLLAVGDIHGHLDKLTSLLQIVKPTITDQLVFLGDYIDRGPDPAGVIEYLLELDKRVPCVFLRGNHEQVALDALYSADPDRLPRYVPLSDIDPLYQLGFQHRRPLDVWLRNEAAETLTSYGISLPVDEADLAVIPQDHVDFLASTQLWYRAQGFLFVHAGAMEQRPLDSQTNTILRDRYCDPGTTETHVVGHQVTPDGQPYFEDGRFSLDTGAGNGQALTACNVLTREIWQA